MFFFKLTPKTDPGIEVSYNVLNFRHLGALDSSYLRLPGVAWLSFQAKLNGNFLLDEVHWHYTLNFHNLKPFLVHKALILR